MKCLIIAGCLLAWALSSGCAEEKPAPPAPPTLGVRGLPRGVPVAMHVATVAPSVVALSLQAGRVEYGRQVPYEKQEGDEVTPGHQRWVKRGGNWIGTLVGPEAKILWQPDRVVDAGFDVRWADGPESYRVLSKEDPAYAAGAAPEAVHRKSKPSDLAMVSLWKFEAPTEHVLFLLLARPLAPGKRYTVEFRDSPIPASEFTCDPARLRSEAVHVSQVGFRPDDPVKVAFLSCWMGSGGGLRYEAAIPFHVIEEKTGRVAFSGKTALAKAAGDRTEDAYKANHNGADVYEMDFSALKQPGTYRVSVEGVGCSFPFPIAADAWRKAFTLSARGFYHQRSGIALGPPYTTFRRPRTFHPDDGVRILASTAGLMDTGNGLNRKDSNFGNLVKGKTDQPVADAWGGYMDAGDWDRRIQHLDVSRMLLELAEEFPETFDRLSLNIPELATPLPDVVDEALFNLECYRRLQAPEGGVRGGIESEEHPRQGEASWQESLTILAYAPCVWSSHVYAGVAARAALWLEKRDPKLSALYRESALRAMRWAEKEQPSREGKGNPHEARDARNLAAIELFRLTGDPQWHALFLQTTLFKDPAADLYKWQHHEQRDSAWVALRTDRPGMDEAVKRNCRSALLREADARAARCAQTGFRWTGDPWRPAAWGLLSSPDGVSLARAHALTGDAKYLRALILACQTGAGANPLNFCYTTGLGQRSPQHPLHIDSRITHQPPPPGLTVFGPTDPTRDKGSWAQKLVAPYIHPEVQQWPALEAYWDVFWYPSICEFTVQMPMTANAYAWGYLAARR